MENKLGAFQPRSRRDQGHYVDGLYKTEVFTHKPGSRLKIDRS